MSEINPDGICEMCSAREMRLRRVKCLRAWGFISFHILRSRTFHIAAGDISLNL